MDVIFDPDFKTFARHALPVLSKKEALNNLMLGIIGSNLSAELTTSSAPVLLRINEKKKNSAFALQTPPHNLLLGHAKKKDLKAMALALLQRGADFQGVVGPVRESSFFAQLWSELSGLNYHLAMSQKIFELKKILWPHPIPGQMHRAQLKELRAVAKMVVAFSREALGEAGKLHSMKAAMEFSRRRISAGEIFLWSEGKRLKGMAALSGPTPNGIRVSLVYTVPKFRGHGVAANLVAHLSDHALKKLKLKYCFLYTDASNPTSNGVYQRIGYKCVGQSQHFVFKGAKTNR